MAGCGGPTSLRLELDAVIPLAALSLNLSIDATGQTVKSALPQSGEAPTLPGVVLIWLPDVESDAHLTLTGITQRGVTLTTLRDFQVSPHRQVELAVTLGAAEPPDGGGATPDLVGLDLYGLDLAGTPDGGSITRVSCTGLAPVCGPAGNADCCAAPLVPGGSFTRAPGSGMAKVSAFYLDQYEVTVGRFRRFVDAGFGIRSNAPSADAGRHPNVQYSGWAPMWDTKLVQNTSALKTALNCDAKATFTATPGANEGRPINCVNWYEAMAFCIWDGGRLPTEAEWERASMGEEQRTYPWGGDSPTYMHAVYDCAADGSTAGDCTFADIPTVGSRKPLGDGKWGHADLAGSLFEPTLDSWASSLPGTCNDCVVLNGSLNIARKGGSFERAASMLLNSARNNLMPDVRGNYEGVRCAYDN
jgi:formylglycine-generating enzyme required for sulfatase activity